jgi:hypothetical protein
LGITLLFAGVVTSATVSILGAVLCVSAFVGPLRKTLPLERHEAISVAPDPASAIITCARTNRVEWSSRNSQQAQLPLEVYPVSAGAKGGLAGGMVMAALAVLYGLVSRHGIWYPINLLASGFFPAREATEQIGAFHWDALIIASAVHLVGSLLVGLLYAVTLPLCPRRPVLLGGLIAPILWSGLIHSFLGTVNPILNRRIHWTSFVICQVGFGLVAGVVVSRQERVRPWQRIPAAGRAGAEETTALDENISPEVRERFISRFERSEFRRAGCAGFEREES